ncbi:hypothetical protein Rsub_05667 [Raphidocelis subcapitata]|uniref:Protein kinase domain-containing protein n=1 Tax=Raphidocelis subcapitata TaxID=307507 RepID=A0A2V0NZL2_9CHLO|nr:hypothetical protein Rsub_05667 [Raphidocelis subcapitata]|eukprot:GBF93056.1 hypothetical protein Rsub_05667 [Raphidocelis subcapitata]
MQTPEHFNGTSGFRPSLTRQPPDFYRGVALLDKRRGAGGDGPETWVSQTPPLDGQEYVVKWTRSDTCVNHQDEIRNEIRVHTFFAHPHVPKLVDVVENEQGDAGLVFPFAGVPVTKAIHRTRMGATAAQRAAAAAHNCRLARAAAKTMVSVLRRLHALGWSYNDLKIEQLVVKYDANAEPFVSLVDFAGATPLGSNRFINATMRDIPPEAHRFFAEGGEKIAGLFGAAFDAWGVALVTYEIATGGGRPWRPTPEDLADYEGAPCPYSNAFAEAMRWCPYYAAIVIEDFDRYADHAAFGGLQADVCEVIESGFVEDPRARGTLDDMAEALGMGPEDGGGDGDGGAFGRGASAAAAAAARAEAREAKGRAARAEALAEGRADEAAELLEDAGAENQRLCAELDRADIEERQLREELAAARAEAEAARRGAEATRAVAERRLDGQLAVARRQAELRREAEAARAAAERQMEGRLAAARAEAEAARREAEEARREAEEARLQMAAVRAEAAAARAGANEARSNADAATAGRREVEADLAQSEAARAALQAQVQDLDALMTAAVKALDEQAEEERRIGHAFAVEAAAQRAAAAAARSARLVALGAPSVGSAAAPAAAACGGGADCGDSEGEARAPVGGDEGAAAGRAVEKAVPSAVSDEGLPSELPGDAFVVVLLPAGKAGAEASADASVGAGAGPAGSVRGKAPRAKSVLQRRWVRFCGAAREAFALEKAPARGRREAQPRAPASAVVAKGPRTPGIGALFRKIGGPCFGGS